MFENARPEVRRLDPVADLPSYGAVRRALEDSGHASYPLRVSGSARKPPFLIDTLAIRIPLISLKTQADALV
jgi:hypothetical protein